MTRAELRGDVRAAPVLRARRRALRVLLVVGAVVAIVASLRIGDVQSVGWLNNFLLVGLGLLIEAVPFLLLGSAVAAAIEVYVPARWFLRFARVPRGVQLVASSFGGFVFPVCECGSVPVARRLMSNGLAPSAALAFMLAAPVVNPVVILSTWFAFRGQPHETFMVLGRIVLGLVVAMLVGAILSRRFEQVILAGGVEAATNTETAGAWDPGASERRAGQTEPRPRPARYLEHVGTEFVSMLSFMLIGASIAAALQTFIPQDAVGAVSAIAVLAIPGMMLFAYLLSLCSESDAILIASFTQFSPVAQLAFLVFGPMLDLKLSALYVGAFGVRMARALMVTITVVVLILMLWLEVLWGGGW